MKRRLFIGICFISTFLLVLDVIVAPHGLAVNSYYNDQFFFLLVSDDEFLLQGPQVEYKNSKKNGGKLLVINGIRFFRNRRRNGKQYWKCSYYYKHKCPTIAIVNEHSLDIKILHEHCHAHFSA